MNLKDYTPPMHIGVVNQSRTYSARDAAFAVEACAFQLRTHAAPLWEAPPAAVVLYDDHASIPAEVGAVVVIVDEDGDDEAAGFHGSIAGVAYGVVDVSQSPVLERTLSHEILELWGNWHLDRWTYPTDGHALAVELCDPVQRDSYRVPVRLFDESRNVEVSNFVGPAWFNLTWSGRLDIVGLCQSPGELRPGGYQISKDAEGRIFTQTHPSGAEFGDKFRRRWSRTRRLVTGSPSPLG